VGERNGESGREGREIKVTDKRMFTPEGELKEEYRDIGTSAPEAAATGGEPAPPAGARTAEAAPAGAGGGPAPGAARGPEGAVGTPPPAADRPGGPAGEEGRGARVEIPGSPAGIAPSFYDLISVLAEPVALYLGDAELPDGSSAENLEAARLYIDLFDVLRQKTAGNLSAQESTVLEDVLYQLRMRYVQKRG